MKRRAATAAMVWHIWDKSGGTAPVVVLFHGGAGSWRHWAHNIPVLSQHYRLLVPDLPGLGESALPPEWRNDAEAVAAGRGRRHRPDHWDLKPTYDVAGFSFGGTMASCVAALHGARVRSVTIIGSGGVGPSGSAVRIAEGAPSGGPGAGGHASHQPQPADDRRPGEDRCAGDDDPGLEHACVRG